MTVVCDTGPLNYLLLIGHIDILPALFTRVAIPRTVAGELSPSGAPEIVRRWIRTPPDWLHIHPDPPSDRTLSALDPGERCVISLALLPPAP